MKVNNEPKLDFDDVLLVPQRTRTASRSNIKLERTFSFYHCDAKWNGIPIFAANMDTVGTFEMSEALSKFHIGTCLHKHYNIERLMLDLIDIDYQWYSTGIKDKDIQKLHQFIDQTGEIPNLCIDVANGYTDDFVNCCKNIREELGNDTIIMAGNVCTPEMVQEIILHGGVDIVKVGIGPGSACTTRLKTGVGYPQLSAIIECAHAAHGLRNGDGRLGLICADGGCRTPADVAKAFAAGADFVMLGGMFAGTDECEGEWITNKNGDKCLRFYGMSSHNAQYKYGGIRKYTASEGRSIDIPHKGSVSGVLQDILGGLRSSCAYIGSTKLKDMSKCAEFVKVNRTHFDKTF